MFFGLNDVAFLAAVSAPALDPDAAVYIAAVEAADTQALEPAVRAAINDFVVGCKADGIWAAIKASCILAGARTLTGALVPLVGAAPTNVGGLFVSGDYDRKTGLVGNGSTKYLDSNRAGNTDPQNNAHQAIFASSAGTATRRYIGNNTAGSVGASHIARAAQLVFRNQSSGAGSLTAGSEVTGFMGSSRSSSNSFTARFSASNNTVTSSSETPLAINFYVFATNLDGAVQTATDARLAFYSIGESLDLAFLDARVTALINAFAAAIP